MERRFSYTVVSNPVSIEHGDLNVLFSGESQTNPGHKLGPKVYDFYLLHHVLSGCGRFQCMGAEYSIGPGETFLIEPQQLVEYESDPNDPWRYRWVAFAGERCAGLASTVGLSKENPVVDTGRSLRPAALIRRIGRSFRERGAYAHLEATGLLHMLFAEYGKARNAYTTSPARPDEEGGQLIGQVVHYLSTQYTETVSIERMAETLGFNRAYISRVFKRHTGMTPVTFLLKLRIDKARELLRRRPELTIEQISSSVGIQDALYFSKQFRRFYGQPPTAYRDDMQQL